MTALVVLALVLGAVIGLAVIGLPLWQSSRSMVSVRDLRQEQEYLRARAAAVTAVTKLPVRAPAGTGAATRPAA